MRSTGAYLGDRLEAYLVGVHNIELLEIQLVTFLSLNQVHFALLEFFQFNLSVQSRVTGCSQPS